MVIKEDLCQWFKNLSPHKRIDYMCGMLHLCLPMELRFIGSFVEDLAKKDFNHLREFETKANNMTELSNFRERDENLFRTKMAMYLALLHSSNRTCSNILYNLFESNLRDVFTVQKSQDEFTVYNILLVLILAVNHPAFTYHQKTKMYEYYKRAEENAEAIMGKSFVPLKKELGHDGCSRYDVLESANSSSCGQQLPSPALSPKSAKLASPVHSRKVHITNIEVKGCPKKNSGEKRHEYKLQVSWSNGEITEVYKTCQELHDFSTELIKHFSEEASQPKQERKLPFFQGPATQKDESSRIVSYIRSLLTCPKHILEWDFLSKFFHGVQAVSSNSLDASTLPRSPSISQPNSLQSNSGEDEESVITCYPAKSLTIYNSHLTHSGKPESLSPRSHVGHSIVSDDVHRLLPVVHPLGQSPVSSPTNSRSGSPATQSQESELLSHQHKLPLAQKIPETSIFQEQLLMANAEEESPDKGGGQTYREFPGKSRPVMEPPPPKDKILKLPNGLVDPTPSNGTINLTMPMTWHHFPYPPPPYFTGAQGTPSLSGYSPFFYMSCHPSTHSGTRDNSPTNSDYSPSQSPFPNVKAPGKSQLDSSSDDNDKDSLNSQDNSRSVGKRKSVPTQISGQTNSVEIPIEDGQISPHSRSHPHQVLDKKDGVSVAPLGVPPVCGYSSDPGFAQTRPQIVHAQYKAQPAHTNIPIHPHNIISMPLENVTVKVGNPYVPMGLNKHHMRDVTMTTNVITASINAMPSQSTLIATTPCETSNRQFYYYPLLNRPIFSNGGRSVVCASTVANRYGEAVSQSSSKVHVHISSPGPVNNSQSSKNGPGINSSLQAPHGNINITNEGSLPTQPHSHMDTATHVTVSMQNAPPTYTTSTVTYTAVSSLTPSQSPSTSQSICSTCGCTGHAHSVPISYPYPSAMPTIPPTQFHQFSYITPTSNGLIPTPIQYFPPTHIPNGYSPEVLYSGAHQSPYNIAQPIPTSVPSVHGYFYGHNLTQNSQQNANHNGGNAGMKQKKVSCYNCGSLKHLAAECTENTMEAMSGHFHLSYRPKTDSE